MDFQDRVAFITGGAQGIGLGIARRLAREGVKLALADIDDAALAKAKAGLSAATAVATYALDVRDRDTFASVAEEVEREFGPVSILCNNAGVAGTEPVNQMNYAMWDWVLGINLGGVVNGTQTFLPRMIERGGWGHIVNTASGAGIVHSSSGHLYATSKFAVVGLSESLREELETAGIDIGVSVLCPGPVATGIVDRTMAAQPVEVELDTDAEKRLAFAKTTIAEGVPVDEVGEMVFRGIRTNSLYVFTDRIVEHGTRERAAAILAALPPEPDDDGGDQDAPTETAPAPTAETVDSAPPKKMRSSTVEARIQAAPSDVYGVIADLKRVGEWSNGHAGYPEEPPADLRPGASFRQRIESFGSAAEVAWIVAQAAAPSTLELLGEAPMGIRLRTLYELAPEGDTTALKMTIEMGGGPIVGPLAKTVMRRARQDQEESLERLKALLAA
jgi:NAD(P)-dependent dehydrogenase (short-subunit alcohol dehydrogenase family)